MFLKSKKRNEINTLNLKMIEENASLNVHVAALYITTRNLSNWA